LTRLALRGVATPWRETKGNTMATVTDLLSTNVQSVATDITLKKGDIEFLRERLAFWQSASEEMKTNEYVKGVADGYEFAIDYISTIGALYSVFDALSET
jgi:hypothetical protein